MLNYFKFIILFLVVSSCNYNSRIPAQSDSDLDEMFRLARYKGNFRAAKVKTNPELYDKLESTYGGGFRKSPQQKIENVRFTVFWRTFMNELSAYVPTPKFIDHFMSYDPGISFNESIYPALKEKYISEINGKSPHAYTESDLYKVQSLMFMAAIEHNEDEVIKWATFGYQSSNKNNNWEIYSREWQWFASHPIQAISLLDKAKFYAIQTREVEQQILRGHIAVEIPASILAH